MTRKLVALGGAALALLLVSSIWETADARRGGGGYSRGGGGGGHHMGGRGGHRFHGGGGHHFRGGGGHHFRGGGHHFHDGGRRHAHRFHGHRHAYLYGGPFVYGYYGYSDGCYWLRQRALSTGSPYWWDRYNACAYGYGYYD